MSFIKYLTDQKIPARDILSSKKVDLSQLQSFKAVELALQCLRCNQFYALAPCTNCAGNGTCYASQSIEDQAWGLFCSKCGHGQTDWKCYCGTSNPMHLTVYQVERRTNLDPKTAADYHSTALCFEELRNAPEATRLACEGFQKFQYPPQGEQLVRLYRDYSLHHHREAIFDCLQKTAVAHPENTWLITNLVQLALETGNRNTIETVTELLHSQASDNSYTLQHLIRKTERWLRDDTAKREEEEREQRRREEIQREQRAKVEAKEKREKLKQNTKDTIKMIYVIFNLIVILLFIFACLFGWLPD